MSSARDEKTSSKRTMSVSSRSPARICSGGHTRSVTKDAVWPSTGNCLERLIYKVNQGLTGHQSSLHHAVASFVNNWVILFPIPIYFWANTDWSSYLSFLRPPTSVWPFDICPRVHIPLRSTAKSSTPRERSWRSSNISIRTSHWLGPVHTTADVRVQSASPTFEGHKDF